MSAPLPPADLPLRRPEILTPAEGSPIERIYTIGREPKFFDRGRGGRLNSPEGSYGVLYGAAEPRGAFAEVFLREPGRTLLPLDLISRKGRVTFQARRPLRLIGLMGAGLARLGATAEVTHGGLPYDVPQSWSKALRAHPERPDGIAYRARHDDDAIAFALFEHSAAFIEEVGKRSNLLNEEWFWQLMEAYAVGVAPT